MTTIDERLNALERGAIEVGQATIPGLSLSRLSVARQYLTLNDIDPASVPDDGRDSVWIWVVGLGGAGMPKEWFSAHTVDAALTKAESWIAEVRRHNAGTKPRAKPRKK